MWGKSGVLLPACLIASFCASLALAQSTTGTIAGNVTDVSISDCRRESHRNQRRDQRLP